MKSPKHSLALDAALSAGALLVTVVAAVGCARRPIIVQAPPATVVQSPPATVAQAPAPQPTRTLEPTGREVIFVKEAPPPPREEAPPPPPSDQYTWVPGYWISRDGHQEWVPGRYEKPPRTNATWVAPRWERRADGYVFIEGYWR
jgi:hypothetical protein